MDIIEAATQITLKAMETKILNQARFEDDDTAVTYAKKEADIVGEFFKTILSAINDSM